MVQCGRQDRNAEGRSARSGCGAALRKVGARQAARRRASAARTAFGPRSARHRPHCMATRRLAPPVGSQRTQRYPTRASSTPCRPSCQCNPATPHNVRASRGADAVPRSCEGRACADIHTHTLNRVTSAQWSDRHVSARGAQPAVAYASERAARFDMGRCKSALWARGSSCLRSVPIPSGLIPRGRRCGCCPRLSPCSSSRHPRAGDGRAVC